MASTWSEWSPLGGGIVGGLSAVLATRGRLVVFGRRDDGEVYHRWQVSQGNGWSGWLSLDAPEWGCTSDPSAVLSINGGIVVFVRGVDRAVWHRWQDQPDGNWSNWASLGGVCNSGPDAVLDLLGRLVVFARGTDNKIWNRVQVAPFSDWSGWNRIQPLAPASEDDIGAAMYPNGGLVVFERGRNGLVRRLYQVSHNWTWAGQQDVPGSPQCLGGPDAVLSGGGRGTILAVRGSDNAIWINQHRIYYAGWLGWESAGGEAAADPAVAYSANGEVVVFIRRGDSSVWHRWASLPPVRPSPTRESLVILRREVFSGPYAGKIQTKETGEVTSVRNMETQNLSVEHFIPGQGSVFRTVGPGSTVEDPFSGRDVQSGTFRTLPAGNPSQVRLVVTWEGF
jgi:hypothetical protein